MAYVIYNKETKLILRARARSVGCYVTNYKSESAAKAALTRLTKKGQLGEHVEMKPNGEYPSGMPRFDRIVTPYTKEDFAIADAVDFRENIDRVVTKRDAMTGEEFEESINADFGTSRASENYYSS